MIEVTLLDTVLAFSGGDYIPRHTLAAELLVHAPANVSGWIL
jgi:hypothetical protein